VAPNFTKHQQQGSAGKWAANSVSAGKKRFEPVRRGVGDIILRKGVVDVVDKMCAGFSYAKNTVR
jgi:hypothetical protein